MARFGGRCRFGTAKFGGDPYGWEPGYMIDNVVAVLRRFTKDGGDAYGRVKSVERLTAEINDNTYRTLSQRGMPAFYVGIDGGTFAPHGTSQRHARETDRLFVIAIVGAGSRGREARLEGEAHGREAGLDQMTRWAIYWVTATLRKSKKLKNPLPRRWRYLEFSGERFAAVIEWDVSFYAEFWEAIGSLTFDELGICHSPVDASKLFADDNETPLTVEGQPETPNVADMREGSG